MSVGYILGIAGIFALKIFGLAFVLNYSVALMLVFPLICVCAAEALTQLWTNTPGSLGLGTLNVFIPMVISGLLSAVGAVALQRWQVSGHLDGNVRNFGTVAEWIVLSVVCSAITLSLWRFWPTPTARLW